MNLFIDENIPFASQAFSFHAKVTLFEVKKLKNKHLKKAHGLITKSNTFINDSLLKNTLIQFIASPTSGINHVDLSYLNKKKIAFIHAAGCNARSVCEYVFSAIFYYATEYSKEVETLTIAIVGCGHIGSLLINWCKKLKMKVIAIDPFLDKKNFSKSLISATKADIISFHVPLTYQTKYPTNNFVNGAFLKKLTQKPLLINASRGEIIKENDLLKAIKKEMISQVILDVFRKEPHINPKILKKIFLATPHIAGYSFDGKIKATEIIYHQFCEWKKEPIKWKIPTSLSKKKIISLKEDNSLTQTLFQVISKVYNIKKEAQNFKQILLKTKNIKSAFETFRKQYPRRLEFHHYVIKHSSFLKPKTSQVLKYLGFEVQKEKKSKGDLRKMTS